MTRLFIRFFILLALIASACIGVTKAQQPIRIGASLSQTGAFAALGQNQLRGYQLCIKHANEKGGVLGRKLELIVEDDQSQAKVAVEIYEKLITQTKVDVILGPYSSPIAEAVANVSEKYKMPMVAPLGSSSSIFKKGRKYVFMVLSPAETWFEGLLDIAVKRGLKTIAIIYEDTLFPKTTAQGTIEFARKLGLQVVHSEAYPKGPVDWTAIIGRVRTANPDVLAAATYFEDAVAIAQKLRELNVSPKMFGVTVGGDLPKFHSTLGSTAEFVYGTSQWEPELVTLRAGGLIPIARQYPGAREFVESHNKEFPGADLSYHSAAGYGGCQILVNAIHSVGSLDRERIRQTILKLDTVNVFGAFRVDEGGFQLAHKSLLFQWQDGKKVIVWPEDIAPGRPRLPTPPWKQRP